MEYTISVVGNANTGKTALIRRFMIGVWPKNYKKTIDVGYYSRIVNTNRGKIRFNVIDAPTEEHISESDGFVVCYDYNDANTKNPLVFSFINNAEKPLVVCATKYADLNNIHAEDEEDIPVDSRSQNKICLFCFDDFETMIVSKSTTSNFLFFIFYER